MDRFFQSADSPCVFPKDISQPPREWAERFLNVQRWSEMPRGRHFAAMEEPELLAEDIRIWFLTFRDQRGAEENSLDAGREFPASIAVSANRDLQSCHKLCNLWFSVPGLVGMAQKEEHSHRESEEKFAKAFRCSPQPFTLSTLKEDRYIEVNDAFELKTGYRREEVIGRTVDELGIWVDYAERGKLIEKILRGEPIRDVECRFRKKTGEVFIGLLSAELLEVAREMCVVANVIDITDWRRTEEALRISEERLRLAQQAARIGTFEWNIRTGVNTWTPELEAIYGLPPGGFGGTQKAFENLVHPDDLAGVIELVGGSLKTRKPANGEWRVVWRDGSVHWIAGRWQVFMDASGEPSRIIGVNIDVTERKVAEEALANMTRKLIESQEQERARIGRELHDDINQRLAMLALELEQLQANPSEVQSRLQELRKQTTELSNDVQALSHEFHASKLEYLGVASGIRSWCKEFGERQAMEIDFKSDVSTAVPFDVGLCLFRVLQESLHNAAKHSAVKRIEVQLREVLNEIHLIVTDLGKGFDLEAALRGKGLGLTSMQERVRLLNGSIEIQSKPMGGTTIHVRVPLEAEHLSQRATG